MTSPRYYFNYNQFPFMPGWMVRVDWTQREDGIGGGPDLMNGGGVLILHPNQFLKLLMEMFGSIAALDMLKIITRDKIDFDFTEDKQEMLRKIDRRVWNFKKNQDEPLMYYYDRVGIRYSIEHAMNLMVGLDRA